ncbi:unnamed protein product [Didymodactylos carnosus]|uniref:Uncharacterized protein n=1 Tax=Didymodactylos carnosus TaxID=1234261 RepID=A0A814C2S9_9BILA|nr:unnamed protein product [Didymodactylos carnosus]CAF0934311.1 unnamed protein product [Didymodactylos carnosus]CAF3592533.1 unnamed protein product [Didymodactylos carnosus]CAF3711792.1 unnamed protein product [Didymodactylos carnosus]
MDFWTVFLFALVCSVSTDDTGVWYKTKMSEDVVPPYTDAYETLQDILKQLSVVNTSQLLTNQTTVTALASILNCQISNLTISLSTTFNASDDIRDELDKKLATAVASTSSQESQIKSIEEQVAQIDVSLQGAQNQLSAAQNALEGKQQELSRAEAALQEAQRKVDAARNCMRRRKGIFSFLNPIVCPVFNWGGIDSAKENRGRAEGDLARARQQVTDYQNTVNGYQQQKDSANAQLADARNRLQISKNTLTTLQQQRDLASSINFELKKIIVHISVLSSTSTVLKDAIGNIVDFNLLIKPLNAIYDELKTNQLAIVFGSPLITDDNIAKIKPILDKVISQLPNMPLNTGSSDC